jgi:hypothetical protein
MDLGLNIKTAGAVVMVSCVVGFWAWALTLPGGRSVTLYADEVSAAHGEQSRSDRFRDKCATVGFTVEQCLFFQHGADATDGK